MLKVGALGRCRRPLRHCAASAAALLAIGFAPVSAVAEKPGRHCLHVLEALRALSESAPPGARPEMMVIGDSITNGVTSLTIDRARAEHGLAALVARGIPEPAFRLPSYPVRPYRPILFNLETELRKPVLFLLTSAGGNVEDNLHWWLNDYPEYLKTVPVERMFDDVSVAQGDLKQLMCDTARKADRFLKWSAAHPDALELGIPTDITSLYYEINLRFVLDPQLRYDPLGLGAPLTQLSQADLSQLGQVILRKPRRLLINIGNNDGLWMMAFEGRTPEYAYTEQSLAANPPHSLPAKPKKTTIAAELNDLVDNLAQIAKLIPSETEHVYIDNLAPPSRVANMDPTTSKRTPCDPGDGAGLRPYFDEYQPYISDTSPIQRVTGAQACAMDREANAVNQLIKQRMTAILGDRVRIVDLYGLLMRMDAKHLGPSPQTTVQVTFGSGLTRRTEQLDNRVVHAAVFGGLSSGGVQGYDNMHPTMVGYAAVAAEVLKTIAEAEPGVHPRYDLVSPQAVANDIQRYAIPSAVRMGLSENLNLWLLHQILGSTPPTETPPPEKANLCNSTLCGTLRAVGHAPTVRDCDDDASPAANGAAGAACPSDR